MNIFAFRNDGWEEYNYEDFDNFFDDIVQTETIFMFSNCTEDEIDDFLDKLESKSTGLDDVDYYRFDCTRSDSMTKDDIYLFYDLELQTLDEVIKQREGELKYFKNLKAKI